MAMIDCRHRAPRRPGTRRSRASPSIASALLSQRRAQPRAGRDHVAVESPRIAVRLTPRARRNELAGERNGVLLARVIASPEGGRANDALCRLIAKRAGVGVRSVSVVRGASSRQKVVQVDGISADDLERALQTDEE